MNNKNHTRNLVFTALMVALCVVIGWVCKSWFTFGVVRITFDNFPVILTGILLGPVAGAAVGISADLVSCFLTGYAINPLITLGAALIGVLSGILGRYIIKGRKFSKIITISLVSHLVGSVLVKSAGLYTIYGYSYFVLLGIRLPLYIVIASAEAYFIYAILKNRFISSSFELKGAKNDL